MGYSRTRESAAKRRSARIEANQRTTYYEHDDSELLDEISEPDESGEEMAALSASSSVSEETVEDDNSYVDLGEADHSAEDKSSINGSLKRPGSEAGRDHACSSKKQRTSKDGQDEDDDEEEVKPAKVWSPKPEFKLSSREENILASDNRLVELVVKIFGEGTVTTWVKSTTISKITTCTSQFDMHHSESDGPQRITFSTLAEKQAVMQAVEFLESGVLRLLTTNPAALLKQLSERIKLFDFSHELDIPDLDHAIIAQLEQESTLLDASVFAEFAKACYDRNTGHRVEKNSSLGRFVKARLARCIPEMVASGIDEDLRRAGGSVAEELMDVVWVRHRKMEQQRVVRQRADRDPLEYQ